MSLPRPFFLWLAVTALVAAPRAANAETPPPDGVDTVSGAGVPSDRSLFSDVITYERDSEPLRVNWNWPKFRDEEFVAVGVLAVATFPALALSPNSSPWLTRTNFDESTRDVLRIGGLEARQTARDTSDILLTFATSYPLLVDAAVVAAWYRDSPDTAWEMAMIDIETFAVNTVAVAWISSLGGRERPYGRLCPAQRKQQDQDCSNNTRYRSFYSGHTSTAFTSAGLMCMHHMNVPLYGGGAADAMACGTAFAAAAATGLLRVSADQHYASDVLMGAAVGSMVGLGVPWLLHYRYEPQGSVARHDLTVGLIPTPEGAHVVGTF